MSLYLSVFPSVLYCLYVSAIILPHIVAVRHGSISQSCLQVWFRRACIFWFVLIGVSFILFVVFVLIAWAFLLLCVFLVLVYSLRRCLVLSVVNFPCGIFYFLSLLGCFLFVRLVHVFVVWFVLACVLFCVGFICLFCGIIPEGCADAQSHLGTLYSLLYL